MNENQRKFRDELKVDARSGYEKIMRKKKLFKLVNDYPEILDSLPLEKLKIIEELYAEEYRKTTRKV